MSILGTVQSHTVVRVPDKAHASMAPFVLLLVELAGGRRVLGHFDRAEPPPIGAHVIADAGKETPVFRVVEGSS